MEPVTVIIPAYNEAKAIHETIEEVRQVFIESRIDGEIIVVDDGSTDETAKLASLSECKLIRHFYNKGYGASLKTGIRQAQNSIIVITDADGTYPNNRIPSLLTEMDTYDMVVGARTGNTVQIPLLRRPVKWTLNQLANYLSGTHIPDLNSGLRAFRKEVVAPYFRLLPAGFSFTTTITLIMLTNDYNVLYIPINYFSRKGKSKIRPIQDTINFFSLVFRMILSFRPLRVFVPVVLFLMVLSVLKVLYDIAAYDFHLATSTVVLLIVTFQTAILGVMADLIVALHKTGE